MTIFVISINGGVGQSGKWIVSDGERECQMWLKFLVSIKT